MDNPRFIDEKDIPPIHQDDDDYNTSDWSRVEETFIEPATTEATSTLRLRQKLIRDKITSLYRHLNVTGNPGLANIDRFMIKKFSKNRQYWIVFSQW